MYSLGVRYLVICMFFVYISSSTCPGCRPRYFNSPSTTNACPSCDPPAVSMTPRPEVKESSCRRRQNEPLLGDEVVISGISGKFPESDSVRDFMHNLYNKVDMVSDDDRRWTVDHPDIPNPTGKVKVLSKFDAQFFGVHYKQAVTMDPMGRMLLESAYGAIIDAGLSPRDLRNTNTGVYIGVSTSDAETAGFFTKDQISGHGLTGTARNMLSNRISYWLGAQGPSYTLHSECSSSLQALEHAYNSIRSGQCDAAIIGGANLCLHPFVSLQFTRLGFLSENGRTKSFDKNANGYGRAETVSTIYLQRAKDAKRVYAQVVHAKSNCDGFRDGRVTYADKETQRAFLEGFYSEVDVLPAQVEYIEAFGAGIQEVDKNELDVIDSIFCRERKDPILVGCIKSNMGHAEAASGIAATTKLCLAYHKGVIAPNLHYSEPREDVAGVREGRIRVVTESTPFPGGYTAASSYSFSGVNVHVLFKGLAHNKSASITDDLPRLVAVSGRSEESLKSIFEELQSLPLNFEQLRLLHNIHEVPISGHVFRGYNVLKMKDSETVSVTQGVDYFPGLKRPVWFVYSGMGSQWSGMGTQLMRIPIFAAAIERCCQILAPKGVDLLRILTDPDPRMYDNILHSFVGIAAVQIGLTDLLTALGIQPDNIIGHSVGELGCAYADGCFTAEEMILSAYSRGLVSVQTPFIRGSMAAVGLSYDEIKSKCPPEIEVACHNGPGSSTISGPADAMKKFVSELTAKGIFAKEVPCSNIAYHSRYIAEAGPKLLKRLQKVIKEPKPRSSRWLSTSVPQNKWDQPSAKLSSPEYHTNNLLSPVLFEETSRQIPPNAITIEVAPHGLLQAILRRSLAADCINVPLTKRGHSDNVQFFLDSVGKLFMAGLTPKIGNIYPAVQFPVSASTPVMSHLVGWEHSEEWPKFGNYTKQSIKSGERHFIMSICDDEYKFIAGNIINGVNKFPAAGYLVLAWETLAMMLGVHYSKLSVVFEGVRFESDAVVRPDSTLELIVMLQKATGMFEICAEGGIVASGCVHKVKSLYFQHRELEEKEKEDNLGSVSLSSDDVYRVMSSKGYSYKGEFRSIQSANISGNKGQIKFSDNWVTFLDAILQMNVLKRPSRGVSKPRLIQKLSIDIEKHIRHSVSSTLNMTEKCFDVTVYDVYDCTRCGGVELEGLVVTECAPCVPEPPLLETYEFVPYFRTQVIEKEACLRLIVQLVVQNSVSNEFNVMEIVDDANKHTTISNYIRDIIEENINMKPCVKIISELNKNLDIAVKFTDEVATTKLLVISNLLNRKNVMKELYSCLNDRSFILSREKLLPREHLLHDKWHVVCVNACGDESMVLLKKRAAADCRKSTKYITVKSSSKFSWVELVQAEWRTCDSLVLVSECDPCAGILGMFNCLRREPEGHVLSLLLIQDCSAPAFRPDLPLYQEQISKNLTINIYQNGLWGSYQYLPLQSVSVQSEHVYLASQRPEDISSLAWLQGPLSMDSKPSNATKKVVQVYYSAVNHMDMKKASGRLRLDNNNRPQTSYGMDFCGRTSTGERVMGLLATGALSSLVEADVEMLWPVPPHWSMEDAVTVPLAYANAFYCLEIQGGIKPGMSVLIHSGSGALGQAAINICLALGCEVFTTVRSQEKKEWLLKIFPDLKEKHIGNSSNGDFENLIKSASSGGCNIILNTLSGHLRTVSMRCTACMGTFVNVNSDDYEKNSPFGMNFMSTSRNIKPASISTIFLSSDGARRKKIQHLIAVGIAKGYVQPLSRVVFGASEASRAFRFTSTGRHVGKVLLKLRDEELRPLVTPERALLPAQPHYNCSDNGNYVVIVGPNHSGLELLDWLAQRGAKNLILHSQELTTTGFQTFEIRSWHRQGVNVQLSSVSLQTEAGCLQLLTDAAKQAPVLGVFVAPRASHRGLFQNSKPEQFAKDFSDKALVVLNLDSATRKLCPKLKQFVVFTSAAVGRGAAGCSSGSLADSVLERICEERGKLGLPALSIQWGADELEISNSLQINTFDRGLTNNSNSLDQLLRSKCNLRIVSIKPYRAEKGPSMKLLKTISAIIGIEKYSKVIEEQNLKHYSVDISMAREIQSLLESDYQVFYTPEKIIELQIFELKQLQHPLIGKADIMSKGLGAFFSYVDPVEFNASDPLVRMPTVISDGAETEEVMYERGTYLILIPGMEGHKKVFSNISERLKLNAFACQLELDWTGFEDSIQNMAATMSQVGNLLLDTSKNPPVLVQCEEELTNKLRKSQCLMILQKLRPEAKFFIFGYSFGVTLALEIATNLEKCGYVGQVFCLDGSPRWFAALLDAHLGHLSEQRLQDEVIKHMFRLMSASDAAASGNARSDGGDVEEALQRSLAAESDWERKLDACMLHLRGRVKFSFQYQRSLVAMAYARIRQARAYSDAHLLSRPLRSELVLLKATRHPRSLSPVAAEELGRDYGLGAYSQRPLTVYELDCDHSAAPFDLNISKILNEHIADIKTFNKRNLCKTYVIRSA